MFLDIESHTGESIFDLPLKDYVIKLPLNTSRDRMLERRKFHGWWVH